VSPSRLFAFVASVVVLAGGCQGAKQEPQPYATRTASPSPSVTVPTIDPATDPTLAPYYTQQLRWSGCGGDFQCATLEVPLDYDRPGIDTIEVSVIRLPATDRARRIGSLVVNPGGPGGSGLDHVRNARAAFTRAVLQRYDIVGFDPRGTGRSTPIDCLSDRETDRFLSIDGSPDSAAERAAFDQQAKFLPEQCEKRSGAMLPHIGTSDVARDVDVLRGVVGDERLYYLGRSYGTFIGATYAELFPRRVGRLVLDGAEDPRVPGDQMVLAQARGFEMALDGFVADCVGRSSCPLGRDRAGGKRVVGDLLARIDRRPLPGIGGRELTEALAVLGVAVTMYDEVRGWPALRLALRSALDGDGSALMWLSDEYTMRGPDGHYENNSNEVIYAVNCLDHPDDRTPAEIVQSLPSFRKVSPTFGDYLAWGSLPCTYWPVQATAKPHAITAPGAPPILVVGTTRDPATPYAWAQGLAAQLQSGVLLTYVGDGHTAYARGNRCIDRAVEAYLISGRPPADGKRCG